MGYKSKPDKHSDLQKILAVRHLRETYEVKRKPSPLDLFSGPLCSVYGERSLPKTENPWLAEMRE